MTQYNKTLEKFTNTDTGISSGLGDRTSRATSGANNSGFISDGMRVFTYTAANPSGSRFTEITDLVSELTLSGVAGDRIYFSAPNGVKPWAIFANTNIIKSAEKYLVKYYSIIAGNLTEVPYMAMAGDCFEQKNKSIFEQTDLNYLTVNKNIDADWAANDDILDTIPRTGENRNWKALEVPPGGIATPAKIRTLAYRTNGIADIDCNKQPILFGTSRIKKSHPIPAIDFWDGAVPQIASIAISSTATQSVRKFRSALGDTIHAPVSLPFGIDTSTPVEISLSYSASAAINTADIELDVRMVSHVDGDISVAETSDLIATSNINIAAGDKTQSVILTDRIDISNFLESDLMFIQIKRADNSGGDFYPLEVCINWTLFKQGKF